jgi:endoglucanase
MPSHRVFSAIARASICTALLSLATACGGGGGASTPTPVPSGATDVTEAAAIPNDAPPGASSKAITTATALGRSVNLGNVFEPPREGDWGLTFTDDLVNKAWDAGFKTVRLPVRWSNHALAAAPYTVDAQFMERIAGSVDKLLAKGFYVMLDMHHYRQLDGDALDPNEASVAGDDALHRTRMVIMWQQIANRFKNHSDKLLFELYNEPHSKLNGEPWNILAARALGQVRQSNPTRVVVIGPTTWNSASDLVKLKVPNDANIIVTIHNYEPFNFTHQGAEWIVPQKPIGVTCCDANQISAITGPLQTAASWSTQFKYPVFLGEFGAYNKAGDTSRINFNRIMRDEAEKRSMSWAYWEFASGFGVYDPVSKTFRQNLLDSLMK